ncbi:MAG: hypothetical protein J6V81_00880 [Bacteroidales bacterium]|nr:hypothetical protein [Bacteroidales bacterium]
MNGEWTLASNCSRGKTDGVTVTKVKDGFTIYRYIEDWDEEGDTIYAVDEYLMDISEKDLKATIRARSDSDVVRWINAHLIKKQSNSLDAIVRFLDEHKVPYTYSST